MDPHDRELRLTTETLEVVYEVDGVEDGFPVILVHGFPDGARTWDGVTSALAHDRLRLYRPYLRGFGKTRTREGVPPTAETAALGDDIIRFADALGLTHFAIVGHDVGARAAYAACVAEASRIAWVVTVATPYAEGGDIAKLSYEQIEAFWYQWYSQLAGADERLRRDPLGWSRTLWRSWSPTWTDAVADMRNVEDAQGGDQWAQTVLNFYRHRWRTISTSPRYAQAQERLAGQPRITVPTTVVIGAEDACVLPASFAGQQAHFDDHRLIEVPRAGHFVQRQFPEAIADAIRTRSEMHASSHGGV